MLQQILLEIEKAQGPLDLNNLARKLGIERSALEGMIQFWVRKGRLKDSELETELNCDTSDSTACGGSCPGPQNCSFVMTMPRTYSLASYDSE